VPSTGDYLGAADYNRARRAGATLNSGRLAGVLFDTTRLRVPA
jgi:hypothetical protein